MMIQVKKTAGRMLYFLGIIFCVFSLQAKDFKVGDTIFVALPSVIIKDDAFIIGQVTSIDKGQDYIISVMDYVKGHDYGLACVPMVKQSASDGERSPYSEAWNIWQDTTVLEAELEYRVPKARVMGVEEGKHLFIERYNLYIVFGRWKSDAPMLTIDRLRQAEREANNVQAEALIPALRVAQQHRLSFYDSYHRPHLLEQTIEALTELLKTLSQQLASTPTLEMAWLSFQKNHKAPPEQYFFLIEAINKVIEDASAQLYREGIEEVPPQKKQAFKEALSALIL